MAKYISKEGRYDTNEKKKEKKSPVTMCYICLIIYFKRASVTTSTLSVLRS